MERERRQQRDALLPAALRSENRVLLDRAQTYQVASPEVEKARKMGIIACTITNPLLLDLEVSTEKKLSGQVQSLVDGQLYSIDSVVNTARLDVKRVLPLHHQLSSYRTQSDCRLEDTVKQRKQEPSRARVATPIKVYRGGLGEQLESEKESS